MDDTERETLPDDFAVEITDLDDSVGRTRPYLWRGQRLTPRQRRLSLAATAALFVVLMGLLLGSTSEVKGLLGQAFEHVPGTPASSALSDTLSVYLRGNPTWGHFTLDGKVVAHPPVIGHDRPLTLARGQHKLVWQAEPFAPKTCLFTVLDSETVSGSCFLDGSVTSGFEPGVPVMIIAFFASLNDLPVVQRAPLIRQLQVLFADYDSSSQVRPGELYSVSEQVAQVNPALCRVFESIALCYARADQPLIATLNLQIDTLTSSDDPCMVTGQCNRNNQDCRMLCEDPVVDYSQQSIEGWSVVAMLSLLWSYRTLSGQVIASAQPDSAIRGSQAYQGVSIHLDRNTHGGWQITLFPTYGLVSDNPICMQATGDTMSVLNASFDNNTNMYVSLNASNLTRMALGCLTVATQDPVITATPTPTPTTDAIAPASFMLNFGMLLAVNASAHNLCPDLPVADAYEKSLAQNLLAVFSSSA